MPPRLVRFCRDLLGFGAIVSLVVVPLFFFVPLVEPFESAKAAALRGLASFLLPVLCLAVMGGWRQIRADPFRPTAWVVGLLLADVAVVGLSTVASVSPLLSLWGSPGRSHGALTLGAFWVFFVSPIAVGGDHRERWLGRAALAVTLASVPVTLYALLQWRGQDPLPLVSPFISSFLGNPNWVGAWLIMAIPMTCALLVLVLSPTAFASGRGARRAFGGVLAGLLLLQLFTVLRLTGRGAAMGLGVGLFFFLLFLGALTKRRTMVGVLGGLLVVGMLLVIGLLLFPGGAALSSERIVTRTGLQRVLMWESVVRLMAGTPMRLLTGYGFDTLGFIVGQAYPTDQVALDVLAVGVTWDRAHTLLLDLVATLGVGGPLLFLAIVGAVITLGLQTLGIGPSGADRWRLVGATLGGGLLAAVLALLSGRTVFALPGLAGGLLGGLALYVVARTWAQDASGTSVVPLTALAPGRVLVAGLLSAILSHFAELQFGFQVMSSELTFWVYAGLVAAIGLAPQAEPGNAGMRRGRRARAGATPPVVMEDSGVVWGILLGVTVASTSVSFLLPGLSVVDWRVLGVLGATWVAGSAMLALPQPSGQRGDPWNTLGVMAGLSLLWSGLFLAAWGFLRDWPLTVGPVPYLLFLGVTLVALAVAGGARAAGTDRAGGRWGARGWLSLCGAVVFGLYLGYRVAVIPLFAEAAADAGRRFLKTENLAHGLPLLRHAVGLAPWRDYYADLLAGGYQAQAWRSSSPEPWLPQAEALLLRAIKQNPADPSHALNLSTLYTLWAQLVPSTRSERLSEARRYVLLALRLDPVRSRSQVEEQLTRIVVQQGADRGVVSLEVQRLMREAAPKAP